MSQEQQYEYYQTFDNNKHKANGMMKPDHNPNLVENKSDDDLESETTTNKTYVIGTDKSSQSSQSPPPSHHNNANYKMRSYHPNNKLHRKSASPPSHISYGLDAKSRSRSPKRRSSYSSMSSHSATEARHLYNHHSDTPPHNNPYNGHSQEVNGHNMDTNRDTREAIHNVFNSNPQKQYKMSDKFQISRRNIGKRGASSSKSVATGHTQFSFSNIKNINENSTLMENQPQTTNNGMSHINTMSPPISYPPRSKSNPNILGQLGQRGSGSEEPHYQKPDTTIKRFLGGRGRSSSYETKPNQLIATKQAFIRQKHEIEKEKNKSTEVEERIDLDFNPDSVLDEFKGMKRRKFSHNGGSHSPRAHHAYVSHRDGTKHAKKSVLTPHTKIQNDIIKPFANFIDAKIHNATSPPTQIENFAFPKNATSPDLPSVSPILTPGSASAHAYDILNRPKLSNTKSGHMSVDTTHHTDKPRRKIRSFVRNHNADAKRHSIGSPWEYKKHKQKNGDDLQSFSALKKSHDMNQIREEHKNQSKPHSVLYTRHDNDNNEPKEEDNGSVIEHDSDEEPQPQQQATITIEPVETTPTAVTIIKVSSPGSVMEEMMNTIDPKQIFEADEDGLAATDYEPMPDGDEDEECEDENEGFDMAQIEDSKQQMIQMRNTSEKSKNELKAERKQKIKKRRASSKRKSFKLDSNGKGIKPKEKESKYDKRQRERKEAMERKKAQSPRRSHVRTQSSSLNRSTKKTSSPRSTNKHRRTESIDRSHKKSDKERRKQERMNKKKKSDKDRRKDNKLGRIKEKDKHKKRDQRKTRDSKQKPKHKQKKKGKHRSTMSVITSNRVRKKSKTTKEVLRETSKMKKSRATKKSKGRKKPNQRSRSSLSSIRRQETLQKAKLQMKKAQKNIKETKERDKQDRKKGKRQKNTEYKKRTSAALKTAQFKKIELSKAVSTALKHLKPAQRRKIELEIKKQLQDEKNAVVKMQEEIETQKEKAKRDQIMIRERFEKEQSSHKKEHEVLISERKALKEQSDEIAALRKKLESDRRMMDAELNRNTTVQKEQRKQHVRAKTLKREQSLLKQDKEKMEQDRVRAQQLNDEIHDIQAQINTNDELLEQHQRNQIEQRYITPNNPVQQPCLSYLNCSQLMEELIQYNAMVNENETKPNAVHFSNLEGIVNQFEYVLQHTHQNQILESIFSQLKHCDPSKCIIFQRNYRNRSKYNNKASIYELYKTDDDCLIVNCQLMDKIHCFCHHSYDDGNRLSIKEQNVLNQSDPNETKFTTLKRILCTKNTNSASPIMSEIRKRMCTKFQLQAQNEYIFGCYFDYDYDEKDHENYNNSAVHFTPKYRHHKEELTQNGICQITIDQYQHEMTKAHIVYNTQFRKKHYPLISKQHLLSLMCYCNFDSLQYEFSKTYRDHSGIKHNNYYHFGRSLKEAVLQFGTRIRDSKQKSFYHGISQPLVPTQIVGDLGKGVAIYCPLSTSTCYTVAVNTFTNQSEGVVIEFGGDRSMAKYFNVTWLSDYANENECLFLQNKHELRINNITDCQSGKEHKTILSTLKTLDSILADDYYQDDAVIKERCALIPMVLAMIKNQLLSHNAKYLSAYAKRLVNVYFASKLKLNINYSVLQQSYTELFELFCLSMGKECINVILLCALFPNVIELNIKHIHLSTHIMDHLYQREDIMRHKLHRMMIKIDSNSALTVKGAVAHYKAQFNRINMSISAVNVIGNNDILLIENNVMNDKGNDIMNINVDELGIADPTELLRRFEQQNNALRQLLQTEQMKHEFALTKAEFEHAAARVQLKTMLSGKELKFKRLIEHKIAHEQIEHYKARVDKLNTKIREVHAYPEYKDESPPHAGNIPKHKEKERFTPMVQRAQNSTGNVNRHRNYKMHLCPFQKKGYCRDGQDCAYAHGLKELKKYNPGYKTTICPYVKRKETCPRIMRHGSCNWRHPEDNAFSSYQAKKDVQKSGYKMNLCVYYGTYNGCRNGQSCQWAHGVEELRKRDVGQDNTQMWHQGKVCNHIVKRCNACRKRQCNLIHANVNSVQIPCIWEKKHGYCYNHSECVFAIHRK
eukprot:172304_1